MVSPCTREILIFIDFPLISSANVTVKDSPYVVSGGDAEEFLAKASDGGEAEPLTSAIDKWHFVHLK